MRNQTRMIAAAVAVTAALAAGSTVAVASATGGKPGAPAKTMSASEKPGHDALVAAVAEELHVSRARVSVALQPLFAAGHADTAAPAVAAGAPSPRRRHPQPAPPRAPPQPSPGPS